MWLDQTKLTILALLFIAIIVDRTCVAFSLRRIFGFETEEQQVTHERRDLIKEFGEEGYKQRLADALGQDYEENKSEENSAVASTKVEYGVDLSYPIQRGQASSNYDWLPHNTHSEDHPVPREFKDMPIQILGDKNSEYEYHMKGCYNRYSWPSCRRTERDRVDMNLRQPPSMQNYTDIGVKKLRAPPKLMKLLTEFYENGKGLEQEEKWSDGNTYTNHWESPTYMLNVEEPSINGGGFRLRTKIYDAAQEILEEWTGEQLTPCSLYGIRIYKKGSILAPHVDRLPLVSSAIINVAQDVDEDWPIEVYAHDGKAYNITMEPGDMVLYESHSVIHGRPFPLKGRFYANVFIHFEPTGHTLRHESGADEANAEDLYAKARQKRQDVTSRNDDLPLPAYILPGTPEEERWRQKNQRSEEADDNYTGTTAHNAAASGRLGYLQRLAASDKEKLLESDKNGWIPLHEAVRGGHIDTAGFLIRQGSDKNARTNGGKGGSVLWWAKNSHDDDHPMVEYLEEIGAEYVEPEF